ncbi:unnamed protein product, partial [Trichogramma brassicae]
SPQRRGGRARSAGMLTRAQARTSLVRGGRNCHIDESSFPNYIVCVRTTTSKRARGRSYSRYTLIDDWEGELPDLWDYFRPEEIDSLLTDDLRLQRERSDRYSIKEVPLLPKFTRKLKDFEQSLLRCAGIDITLTDDPKIEEKEEAPPAKKVTFLEFVVRCGYRDDEATAGRRHKPNTRSRSKNPLRFRATALLYAAQAGFPARVFHDLFRVYNRYDVNYEDPGTGRTHFHLACELRLYEVMEAFLELGQDPNCAEQLKSTKYPTPLYSVIQGAWEEPRLAKLLLRKGADPNLANGDGSTPLHAICVAEHGAYGLAELFFYLCEGYDKEVLIDARNKKGATPLHTALRSANWEVAELLLRRGADPNAQDEEGTTPLHALAARGCRHRVTKVLLDHCDDRLRPLRIDAQDARGDTALHWAVAAGDRDTTELLLRRGADPNAANAKGETPLHVICRAEQDDDDDKMADLAKIIFRVADELNIEVDVNAVDNERRSPLELLAERDRKDLSDLLLARGADKSYVPPRKKRRTRNTLSIHTMCLRVYIKCTELDGI